MATQGTATEALGRFLREGLITVCAASGVVVVIAFFFPSLVGTVLPGRSVLVAALFFFGAGLTYLAVLPVSYVEREEGDGGENEGDDERAAARVIGGGRRYARSLTPFGSIQGFLARQDPVVFGIPVAALLVFLVVQTLAPGATGTVVDGIETLVLRRFDWLFLGVTFVSVLFCLALLVGPWGSVRLGGPDAEPSYTYPVYFTLVFTAGIAAGIVFWGPAEALFHYRTVPPGVAAEPRSTGAIVAALQYTFFHWGISAWSAYAAIGVPVAYFVYNHDAPLRVSTVLAPFLGLDNLDSYWAKLVDVLAVFATIGGIATSVGLVSSQFLTGIEYQWGVSFGRVEPALFVVGLTVIFVVSAVSGVHRGIRRIAGVNVALFAFVTLLVVAVGPMDFAARYGGVAFGAYLRNFVSMSLADGSEWVSVWTVWNWSWWISWAPFAGLFLAALSKGRTVRTVVVTGVFATTLATLVWFLVVGATALGFQHTGRIDALGAIAANGGSEAIAGYPVFAALPLGRLLIFLFLALIITFMVTSADTATLVVAVLTAKKGRLPGTASRVFWGGLQGLIGVVVLLVGADTLQSAAVLTGGPFAIVSLVAVAGAIKTFYERERGGSRSVRLHVRTLRDRFS